MKHKTWILGINMGHLIVFVMLAFFIQLRLDLLMVCALNDLVQLKWSDRVLNEWIDNLIKNRPDLSRKVGKN